VGDDAFSKAMQSIAEEERSKFVLMLPYKNDTDINKRHYPKTTHMILVAESSKKE
jgi:hypothetical protein